MALSKEELEKIGINSWDDIKKTYTHRPNLLLGNGFSINFSSRFMYKSIFEKFQETCDEKFVKLFGSFDTTNFEKIMEYLKYATIVNKILDIPFEEIIKAKEELRDSLIMVVNKIHPKSEEISKEIIENVTLAMISDFEDVFTLNYDLYMYQIIMKSIDLRREGIIENNYQDFFWADYNSRFKCFEHSIYRYRKVYYLHGALFIFYFRPNTLKIKRSGDEKELIQVISEEIGGYNLPLFVSEGTSIDKISAIQSNYYLSYCLNEFKRQDRDLFVYGVSFGDNDEHIVRAIKGQNRKVFISIYIGEKSEDDIKQEINRLKSLLDIHNIKLYFIDSRSVFQF